MCKEQKIPNGKGNLEEKKTGIPSAFQDTIKIDSPLNIGECVDFVVAVFK